jgi:hypothetical protein
LLREFGYAEAPKLDGLLIEYVVFAWLNLVVRDLKHRAYSHRSLSPESFALLDSRLSRAQTLLADACKSLRGVRNAPGPTPTMLYAPGLLELEPNGIIDRLRELMAGYPRQTATAEADSGPSALPVDRNTGGPTPILQTQDQQPQKPRTLEGTQ